MEWEYATESWSFVGPSMDDWPGAEAWKAEQSGQRTVAEALLHSDRPRTERAEELRKEYYAWRSDKEAAWLNTMGAAGYELVAVYRNEDWGPSASRWFPVVMVFCYFKRQRVGGEELPERPILGFRPR